MKTIYLNIQSKGGAGKSMLTYLQALKHENNEKTAFVDLDGATKTSKDQLRFIGEKTDRLYEVDVFDRLKKIEREKLFNILEALNTTAFDEIFIDFGAAESEQLPRLLSIDFSIDEFKRFETEMEMKIVFNVVLAGGTAYLSCFEYLKRITELVKGRFDVYAYINELTFQNYGTLIDEVRGFVRNTKGLIKAVKPFGDIHIDRGSGQAIIDNIREGKGMASYKLFHVRMILNRELKKI